MPAMNTHGRRTGRQASLKSSSDGRNSQRRHPGLPAPGSPTQVLPATKEPIEDLSRRTRAQDEIPYVKGCSTNNYYAKLETPIHTKRKKPSLPLNSRLDLNLLVSQPSHRIIPGLSSTGAHRRSDMSILSPIYAIPRWRDRLVMDLTSP